MIFKWLFLSGFRGRSHDHELMYFEFIDVYDTQEPGGEGKLFGRICCVLSFVSRRLAIFTFY